MAPLGTGSGKLLLFGEHAAVYGHPAIGVSLPWQTRAVIGPAQRSVDTVDGIHDAGRGIHDAGRGIDKRIDEILRICRQEIPALPELGISVESEVPQGLGFGSSAALCAATVDAAVAAARRAPWSAIRGRFRRYRWRLAHQAERIFHGTPSGIDTGLAVLGGLRSFFFSGGALPRTQAVSCPKITLVVGAVARSGDTKALVRAIAARVQKGDRDVVQILRRLGELTANCIRAMSQPSDRVPFQIGRLADEAHGFLREIGLGDSVQDSLLTVGRNHGATGGKLSGAGGGGAYYLVTPDRVTALSVVDALRPVMADLDQPDAPLAAMEISSQTAQWL